MRISAIVSLVCWLSVVALLWCWVLGLAAWGWPAWLALAVWVLLGLGSALVAGRYGERAGGGGPAAGAAGRPGGPS